MDISISNCSYWRWAVSIIMNALNLRNISEQHRRTTGWLWCGAPIASDVGIAERVRIWPPRFCCWQATTTGRTIFAVFIRIHLLMGFYRCFCSFRVSTRPPPAPNTRIWAWTTRFQTCIFVAVNMWSNIRKLIRKLFQRHSPWFWLFYRDHHQSPTPSHPAASGINAKDRIMLSLKKF